MDDLTNINTVQDLLEAQEEQERVLTEDQQRAIKLVRKILRKENYNTKVYLIRGILGSITECVKDCAIKVGNDGDIKAAASLTYDAAQMDVAQGIMKGIMVYDDM